MTYINNSKAKVQVICEMYDANIDYKTLKQNTPHTHTQVNIQHSMQYPMYFKAHQINRVSVFDFCDTRPELTGKTCVNMVRLSMYGTHDRGTISTAGTTLLTNCRHNKQINANLTKQTNDSRYIYTCTSKRYTHRVLMTT
jgi:hypothetical protein